MPKSKTKKDIVKTIAEETGLTQQSAKELVQRTLDSIVQMLADHGRIELRNFGVFECRGKIFMLKCFRLMDWDFH